MKKLNDRISGGCYTTSMLKSKALDYRQILAAELYSKRSRNPRYSLRAFSRNVGISASFLSQILSGKRNLSDSQGLNIAKQLRWPVTKRKSFVDLIRYQRATREYERDELMKSLSISSLDLEYKTLESLPSEIFSNWLHFALTELTETNGFRSQPDWISKRLGVPLREVEEAIHRLVKFGLLIQTEKGLSKSESLMRIPDVPSEAIRTFHKSHLQLAKRAIDDLPFDNRFVTGLTVAFDQGKLQEITDLISEFRAKINSICGNQSDRDSVFHLAIQFYPVLPSRH